MLRHERIVGLVSSSDIRWRESTGYSLLLTDTRVVGAPRVESEDDFWAYFPAGEELDPAIKEEAERRAGEMVHRKGFEVERQDISKITYEPPSLLSGGRLLLSTVGRRVELKITVLSGWNPGILRTILTLVDSLSSFDPSVTFDEKTGGRVIDERAKLSRG